MSETSRTRGAVGVMERPETPSAVVLRPVYTLNINKFWVAAELVNNHVCGNGTDGDFECAVNLSADRLTHEGFVIEVETFTEHVRTAFAYDMFKASCEELCGAVANVAHRTVPGLVAVTVEVFNRTGSVTLAWELGQEVPAFPRKATVKEVRETEDARYEPDYRPSAC
ncbi:MAG TPA: hypothetical protein VD862_03830 [Candidatus Paceibacterota bacterium]|nr:hypothetical protein [Candidatus Paceibacterota bacterium]